MRCSVCKKNDAVVHITNGNTGEAVDLCLECSEKADDGPTGINLTDLLIGLGRDRHDGPN
jgi:protein-arginine kinase activator protein McsA